LYGYSKIVPIYPTQKRILEEIARHTLTEYSAHVMVWTGARMQQFWTNAAVVDTHS
jgi:hypothetical protein